MHPALPLYAYQDELDEEVAWVAGLSIGGPGEYTGLAVLEGKLKRRSTAAGGRERHCHVRHLARFPPGEPYTSIAADLSELFSTPVLATGSTLVVDQTAVGRPVVDELRRKVRQPNIRPLAIVGSRYGGEAKVKGVLQVPKNELVSNLQLMLSSHRIKVASQLADAAVLVRELEMFRSKPSLSPNDVEAWRLRPHDDLVLAVAIAAWRAVNTREFWIR